MNIFSSLKQAKRVLCPTNPESVCMFFLKSLNLTIPLSLFLSLILYLLLSFFPFHQTMSNHVKKKIIILKTRPIFLTQDFIYWLLLKLLLNFLSRQKHTYLHNSILILICVYNISRQILFPILIKERYSFIMRNKFFYRLPIGSRSRTII